MFGSEQERGQLKNGGGTEQKNAKNAKRMSYNGQDFHQEGEREGEEKPAKRSCHVMSRGNRREDILLDDVDLWSANGAELGTGKSRMLESILRMLNRSQSGHPAPAAGVPIRHGIVVARPSPKSHNGMKYANNKLPKSDILLI